MPGRLGASALQFAMVAAVLMAISALSGCGGGGDSNTGGAAGWVLQPVGGGDVIVNGVETVPDGYEPVVGAVVSIEGHSDLTDTSGTDGKYLIMGIPPGTQVLTVSVRGTSVAALDVPIIAGQISYGGAHHQGGGGH